MLVVNYLRYVLAVIRIKITKDYGMCCNEERAIECAREYYMGKKVLLNE